MTEKEIQELEKGYSESKIQHICVCWFRQTFPHVGTLLISIPNGGLRGGKAGAMMKYEGQVKGASDLILLFPSHGKANLCIEMKVPKNRERRVGRQETAQKEWQQLVERYGSVYVICHGLIEFIKAVCSYLHINHQKYIDEALNKYPLYR